MFKKFKEFLLRLRIAIAIIFGKERPERVVEMRLDDPEHMKAAVVQTLAVLQSEGRLLDFLNEDLDSYSDEDIGSAVRSMHRDMKQAMDEHFPVVAVNEHAEGAQVIIPDGFDPNETYLVGNVVGEPPFTGTLKHHGWRVTSVTLPRVPKGDASMVVVPAKVEI